MNKVYWTTKDGREIDIDKMDIDHLRNCLKMIVRNREERADELYDDMDWGTWHDIH